MAFYMGVVRGQLQPHIIMSRYGTFPIVKWCHKSETEEDVVTVFHCGLSNTELVTIELQTLQLCRVLKCSVLLSRRCVWTVSIPSARIVKEKKNILAVLVVVG